INAVEARHYPELPPASGQSSAGAALIRRRATCRRRYAGRDGAASDGQFRQYSGLKAGSGGPRSIRFAARSDQMTESPQETSLMIWR
ncbi:MAG: hypothetical protein O7A03_06710, partial [Alphaproteobacteria bacterium]|nr:hypothetical protein [Alphaproteobacteria bacterium]